MGLLSGCNAVLLNGASAISSTRGWTINETTETGSGSASGTDCAEVHVPGNKMWTGTVTGYGKVPPAKPGTVIVGTFYTGTGGGSFEGSAVVTEAGLDVDIEGSAIIGWTLSIAGTTALTATSDTGADSGPPDTHSGAICKVQVDSSGSFADIPGVRRFGLRWARGVQQYASGGNKLHLATGPLTMSCTIDTFEAIPASLVASGTLYGFRFFVDATTHFNVNYIKLDRAQNVDIEGGGIIEAPYTGVWSSYKRISGTNTKGKIVLPDGTTTWYGTA